MEQVVQMVGAVLILVAFIGGQRGWVSPQSRFYLVVNLIGSVLLCAVALLDSDWGFVLLEGVWAVVSFWGLATFKQASASG